mmetsp:Transcript_5049/g.12906  ORF Transcript_5049/g.12906 Transcript_5049/m.12906 type:complete len:122 (-) Transcript_5049:154-519(-)
MWRVESAHGVGVAMAIAAVVQMSPRKRLLQIDPVDRTLLGRSPMIPQGMTILLNADPYLLACCFSSHPVGSYLESCLKRFDPSSCSKDHYEMKLVSVSRVGIISMSELIVSPATPIWSALA